MELELGDINEKFDLLMKCWKGLWDLSFSSCKMGVGEPQNWKALKSLLVLPILA